VVGTNGSTGDNRSPYALRMGPDSKHPGGD
jgi:hypothetical protein